MTLELPQDRGEWGQPAELVFAAAGGDPCAVTQDDRALVVSMWTPNDAVLRVGVRELSSPGLLVRTQIPLDSLPDSTLVLRLRHEPSGWKLTVNGFEVSDINWNIPVPQGQDEQAFRHTDDLARCTDYRVPVEGASSGYADTDGEIQFLNSPPEKWCVALRQTGLHARITAVSGLEKYSGGTGTAVPAASGAAPTAALRAAAAIFAVLTAAALVCLAAVLRRKKNRRV